MQQKKLGFLWIPHSQLHSQSGKNNLPPQNPLLPADISQHHPTRVCKGGGLGETDCCQGPSGEATQAEGRAGTAEGLSLFFFLSFRRSMNLKNVVKCWWAPSFLLSVQWKDSNCHKHQDFMFFSQSPALRILYSICSSLLCEIYIACILYWALSVQYNLSSPLKIIVAICLFYLFVFSLWNINML